MSLRESFEQQHAAWLAPYGVAESQSGGRLHPEQPHSYRTCFQRDRDRVVHCSAFRRLDFKTQVFVPHEHDHFRTRLTHTLEVAQIGRSLARALRLNEDLVEAVALAHDLGHSPFGHAGETVLDELMQGQGGFEHNRQSLRVVDFLERPYPNFVGLNLSRVVRECLARHRTRYDNPVSVEFDMTLQPPLEGQLVDMADEIAYTSADLEDGLGAGWLEVDQLGELALWQRAWETAQHDAPDARPIHKRIRACKAVLAAMADDLIANTLTQVAALDPRSVEDVRRCGACCVHFSPAMRSEVSQMQDFLYHNVYVNPRSAASLDKSRRVLRELFERFVSDPRLMPERYSRRIQTDGLHRTVCDYIAGMTDRYCLSEHQKIFAS